MELTTLERAVLLEFRRGASQESILYRDTLDKLEVISREFSGVGFFTRLRPASGGQVGTQIVLHDVAAEVEGLEHGAGFVLFVKPDELLLEGFTFDEPWPDEIRHFRVYRT